MTAVSWHLRQARNELAEVMHAQRDPSTNDAMSVLAMQGFDAQVQRAFEAANRGTND